MMDHDTTTSTYLDWAGTALCDKEHFRLTFEDFARNFYGNPHSRHELSQRTTEAVDNARSLILRHLSTTAKDYSVIFTSGCTAALHLLAESFKFERCSICSSNGQQNGKSSTTYRVEEAVEITAPAFVYLQDNHTSVVGMREIVTVNGSLERPAIYCLTAKDVEARLSGHPSRSCECTSLFVHPSQSNFCGRKYDSSWVKRIQENGIGQGKWFVCVDAASLLSTASLDLSNPAYQPDFITLSFYKIFGFPTGLGVLLVKNSSADMLVKRYFGGGTVLVCVPAFDFFMPKHELSERFEDGTLPYQQIISLKYGFALLNDQYGGASEISRKTFEIAKYCWQRLSSIKHHNDKPVVQIYANSTFESALVQGPIVNFNLRRSDSSFVGYSEVEKMAELFHIQLRTGCFCNQGACQHYLSLTDYEILQNYKSGKVCGDRNDLIDGRPVGSVRVSFGYGSSRADVDRLLEMIQACFVEKVLPQARETLPAAEQSNRSSKKVTSVQLKHETAHRRPINSERFVAYLFIYPIKSCAAFPVTNWPLCSTGFKYDRLFMIVNTECAGLTQKRDADLCNIRPLIDLERSQMVLTSRDLDSSCAIPLEADCLEVRESRVCSTKVCQDRVSVADCGDEVAMYLSSVLDVTKQYRLVRLISERKSADISLSLANKQHFLLVNLQSVRALIAAIEMANPEQRYDDVDSFLLRFRPNIVVDGGLAFEEDHWTSIRIGSRKFRCVSKCTRCQLICIDQLTTEKNHNVLLALRKLRGNELTFGIYLQSLEGIEVEQQQICLNDAVFAE